MIYLIIFYGALLLILAWAGYNAFAGKPFLIRKSVVSLLPWAIIMLNPESPYNQIRKRAFELDTYSEIFFDTHFGFWSIIISILAFYLYFLWRNVYEFYNVSISPYEIIKFSSERVGFSEGWAQKTPDLLRKDGVSLAHVKDKKLRKKLVAEMRSMIRDYGKVDIINGIFAIVFFIAIAVMAYWDMKQFL